MHSPTVSILVPNYNHERYLPERIESILNQTYTDFELILMDDYSVDTSRHILESYTTDSRVRLVFNDQNSGSTFRQWHKGFAIATGKYLWIAESDDFADISFLETMVDIMEKDPLIGLVYCNSIIVNENSCAIGDMADWKHSFFKTRRWNSDFINEGVDEIKDYLGTSCTINNASAVLFRSEAIRQCGGIDDSFRYAGDWLMYIKIALRYRIAYLSASMNYYRDHSLNASKNAESNSSLLVERILCLGMLYEKLDSNAHKKRKIKQAADEYATVVYQCTRKGWHPALLGKYIRRIYTWSPTFAAKLHMHLALRLINGKKQV